MDSKVFFKKLPSNFIPVVFDTGWRGHAFYRVFCAHSEVAWKQSLSGTLEPNCLTSLDYPETTSGFIGADTWTLKKAAIAVPGGLGVYNKNIDSTVWNDNLQIFTDECKKEIIIPIHTHPQEIDIESTDTKTIIWGYGHPDADLIRRLEFFNIPIYSIKPYELNHVYNVNIPYLFSSDYSLFETEYVSLINYFDFKPQLNRVRAFILRYLEREKHILLA